MCQSGLCSALFDLIGGSRSRDARKSPIGKGPSRCSGSAAPTSGKKTALARLVIAGSRIAPARRGRWLRRVAHELEANAHNRDTARHVGASARSERKQAAAKCGSRSGRTMKTPSWLRARARRNRILRTAKQSARPLSGCRLWSARRAVPNALAMWLRDWAMIPDMNIAEQVRRVKRIF